MRLVLCRKKGEFAKQFSRDMLILSLSNIKVDNKIIYEVKLWLYLLIVSYDVSLYYRSLLFTITVYFIF